MIADALFWLATLGALLSIGVAAIASRIGSAFEPDGWLVA